MDLDELANKIARAVIFKAQKSGISIEEAAGILADFAVSNGMPTDDGLLEGLRNLASRHPGSALRDALRRCEIN